MSLKLKFEVQLNAAFCKRHGTLTPCEKNTFFFCEGGGAWNPNSLHERYFCPPIKVREELYEWQGSIIVPEDGGRTVTSKLSLPLTVLYREKK